MKKDSPTFQQENLMKNGAYNSAGIQDHAAKMSTILFAITRLLFLRFPPLMNAFLIRV